MIMRLWTAWWETACLAWAVRKRLAASGLRVKLVWFFGSIVVATRTRAVVTLFV
jgi:hypothetical protein